MADPTYREAESVKVMGHLVEIGLLVLGRPLTPYGDVENLDKHTARLCTHMKTLTQVEILTCSLELQIWWRDHKAADELKAFEAEQAAKKKALKRTALAKLTPEELEALGLKSDN